MKNKITALLTGMLMSAMLLSGCQMSKGLETDNMTITQYIEVEIDEVEKVSAITDEDIDAYIQSELEAEADAVAAEDRAVEKGDTVKIDFVGKMNGEVFDGGSAEDYPLTIGSGAFIPGFEDSIIGHKIGETFDWNGKFPDNYGGEEMAGKDVVFTITVNAIVPELSDEWVKAVSEKSKTVEEYKKEVTGLLEDNAQKSYEYSIETAVWEKVMENSTVKKYPEKEVDEKNKAWIGEYETAAEYYGIDYQTFIEEQMGMPLEDFEKQIETAVKDVVKEKMVVEAIADKQHIKLDDKTYEKEVEKMAQDYGYPDVKTMKEAADEDELREEALKNLVKEWLADHCIQVRSE
ncbi:MAG: trigger factor [Dorea sp.]|jgi:trigger factor|nr:trigger factor [Dorea sp.]